MPRQSAIVLTLTILIVLGVACSVFAQQPPQGQRGAAPARVTRPPLCFKEEWKQTPAGGEHPVNPAEALANPNLELRLYGASSKEIQLTGAASDENNPIHLWSGLCTTPCAVALRHKENYADLTGLARLRWVTKVSGFHQVRPIVKLADGTWLVADKADGSTVDWIETDISFADARWRKLDIERLVTVGDWVKEPNLSKVDEIGYVDLMPGSGHGQGGWSDVGKIEVYAKTVKRTTSNN